MSRGKWAVVLAVLVVLAAVGAWQIASRVRQPARTAVPTPPAAGPPALQPAAALEAVAPAIIQESAAGADKGEAATGADLWVAPSEESATAEMGEWQQVGPGAWFIPGTAAVADRGTAAGVSELPSDNAETSPRPIELPDGRVVAPAQVLKQTMKPENRTPEGTYKAAYGISAETLARAGLSTPESVRELERKRQFRRDLAEALKRTR